MIYTPSEHPSQAFILITLIVIAGILGTLLWSVYFLIVALLFWVQYTAILSYLQFRKKRRFPYKGFTQILLHPQVRFFVFEFLAVLGIGTYFVFRMPYVGIVALAAWWLFSLNFYRYYEEFKIYE
ncbi:hypothetical protein DRJ17_04250 [Candidatus Woesearchaeota archaeon]|nr:MAG: hypothetical protein DRJ17_04250 [Candidatus Woesearchaeota archaeon]